jgi:hypothetical protein
MAHGELQRGAEREGGREVWIRLSRVQVEEVVRAAGPERAILGLLRDLGAEPQLPIADIAGDPMMTDRRLSRSTLTGLLVLACFSPPGTERRVSDVADQVHLTRSTAHRFIKTFQAAGLMEQNPDTRMYRLVRR